ncbi:hypothetical protein [Bartonella sp. AP58NXGY]|uniref:hypothetical protein n=1 Tax=Bartonella sp. AP58NXGY TaxID=3243498 RepID=UPI0035D0B8B9
MNEITWFESAVRFSTPRCVVKSDQLWGLGGVFYTGVVGAFVSAFMGSWIENHVVLRGHLQRYHLENSIFQWVFRGVS